MYEYFRPQSVYIYIGNTEIVRIMDKRRGKVRIWSNYFQNSSTISLTVELLPIYIIYLIT